MRLILGEVVIRCTANMHLFISLEDAYFNCTD